MPDISFLFRMRRTQMHPVMLVARQLPQHPPQPNRRRQHLAMLTANRPHQWKIIRTIATVVVVVVQAMPMAIAHLIATQQQLQLNPQPKLHARDRRRRIRRQRHRIRTSILPRIHCWPMARHILCSIITHRNFVKTTMPLQLPIPIAFSANV